MVTPVAKRASAARSSPGGSSASGAAALPAGAAAAAATCTGACKGRLNAGPGGRSRAQALRASMPQRASAASSALRASTQRAPCAVCSFFQNGACVLR